MALTKEAIIKGAAVEVIEVSAPELGGDGIAFLRKLSIKAREDWECWSIEAGENGLPGAIEKFGGFRCYLLVRTICDAQGKLLFDDADEGVRILQDCDGACIDRLYDSAVEWCGLSQEAVDELAGNSEADPSDDSS